MLVLLFFLISRLINWSGLRITHSKVPSSDLFCNQAQFGNSKICNKILILVQCVKSKNLVFSFIINIICFQKPSMIASSREICDILEKTVIVYLANFCMRAFVWDWVLAGKVEKGGGEHTIKWKRVYVFKPLYLMNMHVIVFIFEAYSRGTAFIFKRNSGGGILFLGYRISN